MINSQSDLYVYTQDSTKAKSYSMTLKGGFSGTTNSKTVGFTIVITNKCPSATVIIKPILDQTYTIG